MVEVFFGNLNFKINANTNSYTACFFFWCVIEEKNILSTNILTDRILELSLQRIRLVSDMILGSPDDVIQAIAQYSLDAALCEVFSPQAHAIQ